MVKFGDNRLPARFWDKVERRGPKSCWPWTAAKNHGYGYFRHDGRTQNAHRVAYAVLVAPIPEGFDVDHLCHGADTTCGGGPNCPHRACCNPAHLEAVIPKTNKLRGRSPLAVHAAKTRCPQGHPLSGDNLWIDRGARICRACKLAQNAKYKNENRERLRAAAAAYKASMDPEVLRERNRNAQARHRARTRLEQAQ